MLSEAGASLMGQEAVVGRGGADAATGALQMGSASGASGSNAAAGSGAEGGKSPSAPRWISTALGSDEARYLAVRFLIAPV